MKHKKKKRLPSIPSLRKKGWKLVSEVVRRLPAGWSNHVECVTCGKLLHWKEAHAGHFIPRARGIACYFECRNIHPQCPGCNFFGGEMVKIKYTQWMSRMYGQDEVDRLIALAATTVHWTRSDYEELIEHYRRCLDEIENLRVT